MLWQERFPYGPGIPQAAPVWQGRRQEEAAVKSSFMEGCVNHWKERGPLEGFEQRKDMMELYFKMSALESGVCLVHGHPLPRIILGPVPFKEVVNGHLLGSGGFFSKVHGPPHLFLGPPTFFLGPLLS